ncbi:MAG: hypothetical protein NXI15_15780 [Gammaproteobacteria bacterium]|nr:hypothetical protein [Gammaproteobacteria bacterium]
MTDTQANKDSNDSPGAQSDEPTPHRNELLTLGLVVMSPTIVLALMVFVDDPHHGGLVLAGLAAAVYWTLALITTVIFLFNRENHRVYATVIVSFLIGPYLIVVSSGMHKKLERYRETRAVVEFKRLCEQSAGIHIDRRVADVISVAQLTPMPTENRTAKAQYKQEHPWVLGMASSTYPDFMDFLEESGVYRFFEQAPENLAGKFTTIFPADSQQKRLASQRSPVSGLQKKPYTTPSGHAVQSRYGWQITDLTTRSMRGRWIAAGKMEILDLQDNTTIASLTGFTRARVLGNTDWDIYINAGDEVCPKGQTLQGFMTSVLQPVSSAQKED